MNTRFAICVTALILPLLHLRAASIPIVFNNISGIDNNLVWIQFLGGTNVSGHYFDLNGTQQPLTANTAYSLASLISSQSGQYIPGNEGSPTLWLENVISGRIYISYGLEGLQGMGSPGGPYTPAVNASSDPNYTTRYQYFEMTVKDGTITSDLSYIDFTAISFSMFGKLAPNSGHNLTQTSVSGQQLVNATAALAVNSTGQSSPNLNVIPGASAVLPSPEFARVIGPGYTINVNDNPTAQEVYRDFSSYLDSLGTNPENGKIAIAGLFAGAGQSSDPTLQQQMYNFTATFSGTVANGGSVTLTAVTTSGVASGDGFASVIPTADQGTGVGSNNSITITYAELNAVTGIYGANPSYTVTVGGVAQPATGGLVNDFYGWVVGDLLAGLSLGYVGSDVKVTGGGGTTIGQLASSGWWGGGIWTASDPGISQYVPSNNQWIVVNNKTTPAAQNQIYSAANSALNYNIYANALTGPGTPLTNGYSFPFGDRLGANLLSFNVAQDANAYLQFQLNSDSGQAVSTYVWDSGAGTANWSDDHNWNPNTGPTSGALVEFGTGSQTSIDLTANQTVGGIFFNPGSAAFTLTNTGGYTLTLAEDTSAPTAYYGYVVNNSARPQTIQAGLVLNTDATISANTGDLSLASLDLGTYSATFNGNGPQGSPTTTTVSGAITGSGDLTKSGLSTLILNGTNSGFSGTVELLGGTLQLNNGSAAGTGTLELAGGALQAGSSPISLSNALSFGSTSSPGSSSTVEFLGTNAITFTGATVVNGPTTLSITSGLTVSLEGVLSSPQATYSLTQTGGGTLTIAGSVANPFAGPLAVNQGTLNLNKSTGPAFTGNLTIGDGTGAAADAIVNVLAAGQAPVTTGNGTSNVTINSDGELALGTNTFNLLTLTLNGGSVTGAGSTLSFAGNGNPAVTFAGANSTTATIQSNLALNSATVFNIASNQASGAQVTVSGDLSGSGALTKNSDGTVIFTGSNSSYTGAVSINAGILGADNLAGSAVTLNTGGTFSPGAIGVIQNATLETLTLQGGSLLFDLGTGSASDEITIGATGNLYPNKATTFIFNSSTFTTGSATFDLLTGPDVSGLTPAQISSFSFASLNIPGLTGTFQLGGTGNDTLQFLATAGISTEWTGTTNGNWNTGTNWNGNAVPVSGSDLEFGTSSNTSINTQTNQTVGSLTFNSGANAFTLSGNTITLGGNITNNSTSLQTINSNLTLNYSRTVSAVSGGINLGTAATTIALSTGALANTLTFDVASGQTVTVAGNLQNLTSTLASTDPNGSIAMTGDGTLVLTGTNTFSGSLTFEGGTVSVSSINALGANQAGTSGPPSVPTIYSTLIFDGGTLATTGNMTYSSARPSISILENGASFNVASGTTFGIQAALIGAGGITKTGDGTLALSTSASNSTYTGPLDVQAGTVTFDSAGEFGQTSGVTVSGTGALQFSSNMTLTPTFSLGSTGNATTNGAVNIQSAQVGFQGAITLTAASSVYLGGSPTVDFFNSISLQGYSLTLQGDNTSGNKTVNIHNAISGSGALILSGNPLVTLQNTSVNTFTGGVQVNGGLLNVTGNGNLAGTSGTVSVASGGALQFNLTQSTSAKTPITVANDLQLAGSGYGTIAPGAIYNLVGLTTLTGNVSLTGATTIAAASGGLNFSGAFNLGSNALTINLLAGSTAQILGTLSGSGVLNLPGSSVGQLTLGGDNSSFSGAIGINGGSLLATHGGALGTGAVTVANNTALVLQTTGSHTFSAPAQTVSLSGQGLNTTGALRSLSGDNTFAGSISANAGTFFQVDSGSLTLNQTLTMAAGNYSFNAVNTPSKLTVSGGMSGGSTAAPLAISVGKSSSGGTGTVNFSGNNSALYATINLYSGTLEVGANAMTNNNLVMSSGTTLVVGEEGPVATVGMKTLTPAASTTFVFDIGATADQINLTAGGLSFGSLALTFQLEKAAGFAGAGTYTLITGTGAIIDYSNITLDYSTAFPGYSFALQNGGAGNTELQVVVTGSGPVAAVWVGGGANGDWTTAANWQGSVVPASGSDITFGGTSQLNVNPTANQTTGALTFDTGAGPFVIDTATPQYSLTVNGDITNNSTNLQTINSTVIFTNSRSIDAASGDLAFQAIQIHSSTATPRTLTFTGANDIAVTGVISDTTTAHGNLALTGTGIVTLTGVNTFAGTVTLGTGSTLAINSAAALGNGSATNTLIFNGGTLKPTGAVSTSATSGISLQSTGLIDLNSQTVTLNGVISGTGGLTTSGTGTLALTGTNTYSGVTTIGSGGTLTLGGNSALGASSNTIIQSGATLQLSGGLVVGARPLQLSGTGVNSAGALQNLSGNNSFAGPITLAAASTIQSTAGTLNLTGGLATGGFTATFAPQTGAKITSSGGITGTGGVTVNGPGTVTLSGSGNTYSGATLISQGTLATGSLASSDVTLQGGSLSPGAVGTIASITVNGLTLDGGDLLFDLGTGGPTGQSDLITITGTASLTSPVVFQFNGVNYTAGTFTLLTGTGVSGFNLADLSYQSTISGFAGSFQISGNSLQFVSGGSTGSTWTGDGGNGNWTDAANWNPNGVPAAGANLIFGSSTELTVDTEANRSLGTLTFSSGAGAYTIENNTLTLAGNLTNNSTSLQTITSSLALAANLTLAATAGDLALSAIQLTNSNTARTLTFDGAKNTTVAGVISDGGSDSNLIKNGTGTLTLQGTNTYSGTTTLNAGVTAVGSSAALGDGSATNTLIFNGGTLQATANLSLPATSGSARGITLTGAGFIDSNSFDVDIATTISGAGALAKLGDGTLTLTGDNTYQNVTAIHQGVVNIQSATALGSTAAGTAVAGGAALELEGGLTVGAEALALNGSGINENGALRSVSGTNTYGGGVTLGSASEIQVDADSLALTGAVNLSTYLLTTDATGDLTISGIISGSGGLTKEGAGTLALTANNTFTGTTTVSAGLLQVGTGGSSGNLTGALVNNSQVEFNSTTNATYAGAISGNGTIEKLGSNTLALTGNTTAFTGTTTITDGTLQIGASGATGSLSGDIVNNATLAFDRTGSVTYAGDISGSGDVEINGTGTVTFTGTNTYTGDTTISQGTLASGDLASSDVTLQGGSFSPGGTGTISTISVQSLTLDGGDLLFDLGTGSSDLIQATALTNALTLSSHTVFVFDSVSFAPGTFTLLSGANAASLDLSLLSFTSSIDGLTGTFQVNGNDLQFIASLTTGSTWDGGAGNGNWNTAANWDPTGVPATGSAITFAATVQTTVDTQTNQSVDKITFDSTAGAFVINNNIITLADDVTNNSTATQTINSDLALTSNLSLNAASGDLVIGGDIALSTTATIRTLTIEGVNDVTISGIISNGTAAKGNLIMDGTGTLTLTGANTYSGTTTVNSGTLAANSSAALGDGSATNTLILNNATLLATGNLNSPATRGVTLQGTSTLNTGAFAVTLAGTVSGTAPLTKTGTGTLTLSGANTYTGVTSIQAGVVNIQSNTALGAGPAGVTVASGAALELQNNLTVASKALTLNGTGVSNNGALRNISGTNTYGGAITLASASQIQVDAGTLNITTGITLGSYALTTDLTGDLTVSGIIAGTGSLTKTGAGTLLVTGDNTYTGTTTVSSGVLQIGNGGAGGDIAGAIVNNASVVFNHSGNYLFDTNISGTGSVTKNGTDTLALTGTNTFSGPITINAGTLQIGNNTSTGSLAGNVVNNGALTFNRTGVLSYNGSISGSGGINQLGAGTVVLGGNSTYSGNTVITYGVIRAVSANALGSTSGGTTVANGASLELAGNVTIGAEALSLEGTGISGSGALRNVSGNNTYGGAISLAENATLRSDGGTLTVGNSIANNGHALTVNAAAGNVTFSQAMTGAGGVTKTGAGTLRVNHANGLGTGAVSLNAGTLALTGSVNASTFNWTGGQIALDLAGTNLLAATDFDKVGSGSFNFSLSNPSDGEFTLVTFTNQTGFTAADFTATFTNGKKYDFVFDLQADKLVVSLSRTAVVTGPDLNNGEGVPTNADFIVEGNVTTYGPVYANVVNALTFMPGSQLFFDNNTVSVTSGGVTLVPGATSLVYGNGTFYIPNGFNLLGEGALNVLIPVEVTGPSNVNAGTTLYVNNSWTTQQLNVLAGGALYGSGIVNGAVVNSGTINPGNSPGTLTVNGNFTQTQTGTFLMEIASAASFDQLVVNGNASLAGTLQISLLDGFLPFYGQRFEFIDAFSMEGNFTTIDGLPDGFRGRVIEENGDATLIIAPSDYRIVAQNQNQRNVAGALNSFIPATSGDRQTVSIALDELTAEEYPAAFTAIAPGYYESLPNIIVQQNNTLGQTMTQQMSSARQGVPGFRTSGIELLPVHESKGGKDGKGEAKDEMLVPSKDNRWGIWTMATGIFATTTSVNNLPNYHFDTGGFLLGVDFRWNEALVTGIYAGYQFTDADYGGDGGNTRINTFNFGAYATWQPTPGHGFYVDGIVGGGFSDYKVQRTIQFGSVDRGAVSKPQGGNLTTLLNAGYDWQVGGFTFGPIASAQYTYASVGGFTETGADSLNLRVNQYGTNSLMTSLGGRVTYTWIVAPRIAIIPEARLLWQHEFLQNPSAINASLDGGAGSDFDWTTAAPARDSVYAGVGVTVQLGDRWNANVYYNADFGANDFISHSITAGLRTEF